MSPVANRVFVILLLALQSTFAAADDSFDYRNEVARIQAGFAAGTRMLREDQVDAMIGILRDADEIFQHARPKRDQVILDRAAAVLTPAQYAALDARIRRERGHLELLRIAAEIVPLGKSGVTRKAPGTQGRFLVGVNDDMLVKDPEYRRALLLQARRQVESTYVDVPQVLGLSPQLADQLFSLLVTQQLARLDNPAGPYHAWSDRLRQEERELKTLLGERDAARFSDFRDAFGYRFRVKQLQVDIGAGPDALRQDQVEALIAAWRDADQQTSHGRDFRRLRDARLHEAAAAFLAPPQLGALDAWLRRSPE